MELSNEFRVSVPIEEAWKILTDLERIAPCMPGAELLEVEGEEYRGAVKVKVGPITVQYKGVAKFLEKDDAAHKAVLSAEGRETRGQGNASATVTAILTADGDGTKVDITTDPAITGKVAQFGRGLMADVSGKLLGQFVQQLEADVLTGTGEATPEPETVAKKSASAIKEAAKSTEDEAPPTVRVINSKPAEPVDLFEAAGSPVAKRVAPLVGVALVVAVIVWLFARRK